MGLLCYTTTGNLAYTIPEDQITKTKLVYPVTLCEAKRHLRIHNDFKDDDDYISDLIKAATTLAENYINKDIAKTSNVLRINEFYSDSIKIYEGNFLSLTSVLNASSVAVGTVVQTSKHFDYFSIEWTAYIDSDPLTINFNTGYEEDECPELIKSAILIKIGDLYDNSRSSWIYSGMMDSKTFETIMNYYVAARF
jgi:hypothetical protein